VLLSRGLYREEGTRGLENRLHLRSLYGEDENVESQLLSIGRVPNRVFERNL
jgi:hypothetical protein